MARCMMLDYLLGRSVVDPPFREQFLADPAGMYKQLGGSRLVPALAALTPEDRKALGEQLASIANTLGDSTAHVADRTGLALVLGGALTTRQFHEQVLKEPAAAVKEYLFDGDHKGEIAKVLASPQFKQLGNLSQHREALQAAGERFDLASSRSSVKAAITRDILRQVRDDIEAGKVRW